MLNPDDPDGYGPIDAVVTWCDGADPAFQERRQERIRRLRREEPALAAESSMGFDPARYIQYDEIRYCIRAILNRAPWIRKVWLVTDRQFPSCFDRAKLDPRIELIDHQVVLRDVADALPVFNSNAIETLVWRMPGLADRFILFNDDVILSRPALPGDFFEGDRPVLHGRWTHSDEKMPKWYGRRIRAGALFGYDPDRFFVEAHVCFSISRPNMVAVDALVGDVMVAEARKPFRSANSISMVGMHSHYSLRHDRAVKGPGGRWFILDRYPAHLSVDEVRAKFAPIAKGKFLVICINSIGSFLAKMPDIYDYLEVAAGPRLPFEIGEPLPADAAAKLVRRARTGMAATRSAE